MLLVDHLYGYITPVLSEIDFRRGQTIPEGRINWSQGGTNCTRGGRTNWTDHRSGPRGGQVKWHCSLPSRIIRIRGSGVSQVSPVRVRDIVKSSCGIQVFRKGKVRAAWEVLSKKNFILDKN